MMSSMPAPAEIVRPLPDLSAWIRQFREAEIPVLRETVEAIAALSANEDATDANSIGEMIGGDPLMTLKILIYASAHRSRRVETSVETIIAALVMMGIPPFFRAFAGQQAVEDRLSGDEHALAGVGRVLRRAHRGARFALAFAIQRTDPNAATIHAAALLHEFAELLLWCHAPKLALAIEKIQGDDVTVRSAAAQQEVLNIDLASLQEALISAWQLPRLLSETGGEAQAGNAGARTVALSARLARHTANGWDNAALPDDIAEISGLLNLSVAATQQLAMGIDEE
ncbi:MAG: HDOD domain-containing protein [Caldimonas sp.]